ncbi:glycoside hydrolase family 3 C-terminal domain-containing protein [Vallitalea pronyensis]|uniref:Glycoside hydrolase family 3 C-terminal domain-containing protein n=1 Tax=Vallitalea pronyensis TaxID=1348613 RepID=A0A8J8MHC6_9FIRM|nr:glycoside hydrolase family 3 C-terminal domain-containing protein [Vallitalea pronyensis]QUI21624.1 glycoside hydrolase family 3 C-terminal domain-containing protein [Vallitalea pronyensis]
MIKQLVQQMTLEEKASLCSGSDFWHTQPIERLNIPAVMVSDGPHGLRKQDDKADHLAVNESIKAVCFPAGCATAASFDRQLLMTMGEAIGESCQAEKLSVVLGPAVNIKRSPLCGRNFEYFSEDPYLTSEMATSFIHGVQSKNVGTSLKHYAANNQEHRRMSSSSEVDERTMREIYLAAFEKPVMDAKPWTVMCSYNKINGTYASESRKYLTEILRDEWGFDGYVVSDWGATADRVQGIIAGMDLEMPSSAGINDRRIVEAVKNGELDEDLLDQTVERILTINYRYLENAKPDTKWDKEAQHALSAHLAAECMVLLKNEDHVLPLSKTDDIAFIGEFAQKPRFQGGGSSHINCFKITSALEAVKDMAQVTYAKGYDLLTDTTNDTLIKEAVAAAKQAKVAVVFAGLPDIYESEGYDRTHMGLPDCQNEVIRRVAEANPNTVVVLHNGSPVEMPWVDDVKGILEAYLGGQAVGLATTRILFGEANPCGKLPETFPKKLEDNPSYIFYGGEKNIAEYREGVFVGYRYYDKKNMDVCFPFGFGLSYTTFAYSHLVVDKETIKDTETVTVSVDVTNTGHVAGKEVVQLYIADHESTVIRPIKELKEFEKVALMPGETKTVTFFLDKRAFAYWNTHIHDWHVETGTFDILIGQSSQDIHCRQTIDVQSTVKLPVDYDMNSILLDLLSDPDAKAIIEPLMLDMMKKLMAQDEDADKAGNEAITLEMSKAMMQYMPLRAIVSFGNGQVSPEQLAMLLKKINNPEE